MNLVTGTGYSNSYPVTVIEMIMTMILLLIGNIIFAVAFGLLASLAPMKTGMSILLDKLRNIFDILKKSDIPINVISRLEAYYVFNDCLAKTFGELDCKLLYNHLPKNIVNKISYECNRHILKKMPFFQENDFVEIIEKVSLHMVPKIYLPNEYVIYKNDIGEEMYFITVGSVDILSPDNNKIVKVLQKGEYFGEMALLNDSKRMCSVISNCLSLLYLLKKAEFIEIIKDYSKAVEILKNESINRRAEAKVIQDGQKRNFLAPIDEEDETFNEKNIEKTLNLYNPISPPFFEGFSSEKNMTALTGMTNITSDAFRDLYENGKTEMKLYKRRPNITKPHERRHSQESLRKEVVLSNISKMKMIFEENNLL